MQNMREKREITGNENAFMLVEKKKKLSTDTKFTL